MQGQQAQAIAGVDRKAANALNFCVRYINKWLKAFKTARISSPISVDQDKY